MARRAFTLFAGFFAFALGSAVEAAPRDGRVVEGSGSIERSGNHTDIRQQSDFLATQWGSFNIAAHESVQAHQPNSTSRLLIRVDGSGGTNIAGSYTSNGITILENQNGVQFSRGAIVNVGGLLATSSRISGVSGAHWQLDGIGGAVVNHGQIVAGAGGAILAAVQVQNTGDITAKGGDVALGAGSSFTVDFAGSMVGFEITQAASGASLTTTGKIESQGGIVSLSAQEAQAVRTNVVSVGGVVKATKLERRGGVVYLSGGTQGIAEVSGDVSASDKVQTTGEYVVVKDGALLKAPEILVGGDFQGGGDVQTAQRTLVERGALLNAGAEGRVIVWSDDVTWFNGNITAPGGFAEVSGKETLASVNLAGIDVGELLLDPTSIIIATGIGIAVPGNVAAEDEPSGTLILNVNSINSSTSNLTLVASMTFVVNAAIDKPTGNLTLSSNGAFGLNANINNGTNTLTLIAGGTTTGNFTSVARTIISGALNITQTDVFGANFLDPATSRVTGNVTLRTRAVVAQTIHPWMVSLGTGGFSLAGEGATLASITLPASFTRTGDIDLQATLINLSATATLTGGAINLVGAIDETLNARNLTIIASGLLTLNSDIDLGTGVGGGILSINAGGQIAIPTAETAITAVAININFTTVDTSAAGFTTGSEDNADFTPDPPTYSFSEVCLEDPCSLGDVGTALEVFSALSAGTSITIDIGTAALTFTGTGPITITSGIVSITAGTIDIGARALTITADGGALTLDTPGITTTGDIILNSTSIALNGAATLTGGAITITAPTINIDTHALTITATGALTLTTGTITGTGTAALSLTGDTLVGLSTALTLNVTTVSLGLTGTSSFTDTAPFAANSMITTLNITTAADQIYRGWMAPAAATNRNLNLNAGFGDIMIGVDEIDLGAGNLNLSSRNTVITNATGLTITAGDLQFTSSTIRHPDGVTVSQFVVIASGDIILDSNIELAMSRVELRADTGSIMPAAGRVDVGLIAPFFMASSLFMQQSVAFADELLDLASDISGAVELRLTTAASQDIHPWMASLGNGDFSLHGAGEVVLGRIDLTASVIPLGFTRSAGAIDLRASAILLGVPLTGTSVALRTSSILGLDSQPVAIHATAGEITATRITATGGVNTGLPTDLRDTPSLTLTQSDAFGSTALFTFEAAVLTSLTLETAAAQTVQSWMAISGGSVSLTSTGGDITIGGDINVGTGSLTLIASGNIVATGTPVVTADTLTLELTGASTFDSSGAVLVPGASFGATAPFAANSMIGTLNINTQAEQIYREWMAAEDRNLSLRVTNLTELVIGVAEINLGMGDLTLFAINTIIANPAGLTVRAGNFSHGGGLCSEGFSSNNCEASASNGLRVFADGNITLSTTFVISMPLEFRADNDGDGMGMIMVTGTGAPNTALNASSLILQQAGEFVANSVFASNSAVTGSVSFRVTAAVDQTIHPWMTALGGTSFSLRGLEGEGARAAVVLNSITLPAALTYTGDIDLQATTITLIADTTLTGAAINLNGAITSSNNLDIIASGLLTLNSDINLGTGMAGGILTISAGAPINVPNSGTDITASAITINFTDSAVTSPETGFTTFANVTLTPTPTYMYALGCNMAVCSLGSGTALALAPTQEAATSITILAGTEALTFVGTGPITITAPMVNITAGSIEIGARAFTITASTGTLTLNFTAATTITGTGMASVTVSAAQIAFSGTAPILNVPTVNLELTGANNSFGTTAPFAAASGFTTLNLTTTAAQTLHGWMVDMAGSRALTLASTGGVLTLNGAINNGTGDITLSGMGGIVLGSDTTLTGATIDLTGALTATSFAFMITATGNITLNDNISLGAGGITLAGGAISLTGNVTGAGALAITATGNITISDNISLGTGALTLNAGTAISNGGATTAPTLTASTVSFTQVSAFGDTALFTFVTPTLILMTPAAQTLEDWMVDSAGSRALTLASTGDVLTLNGDINGDINNGAGDITLSANSGFVQMGDVILTGRAITLTGGLTGSNDLTINASGVLTLNNGINLNTGDLVIDAMGGTTLGGVVALTADNITLTGDITSASNALTLSATTLLTLNSNINTGTGDLTLNLGTAARRFHECARVERQCGDHRR